MTCIQPKAEDMVNYSSMVKKVLEMIDDTCQRDIDLIVIPECVFPAYYLGGDDVSLVEAFTASEKFLAEVANRARLNATFIAIGVAEKVEDNIYNSCLLFDRSGIEVAKANKINMWHFDSNYFTPGEGYCLVDTEIGKLGLIVCADGRVPEIIRCLVLDGAEIIVDVANLTSTGQDAKTLTNAQCAYMLEARALENKVWFIMADKCGLESGTILNAGRSCVINPDGETIVEASPHKEEIIYAEIEPENISDKLLLHRFHLDNRRPELYQTLTEPITQNHFNDFSDQQVTPKDMVLQGSVAPFGYNSEEEYLEKAIRYIEMLEDQFAELVVLPEYTLSTIQNISTWVGKIQDATINPKTVVVLTATIENESINKTSYLITKNELLGTYNKTHIEQQESGLTNGNELPVFPTPKGNIGIIHGMEGFLPEVPRVLTLKGADLIIWINDFPLELQVKIARTRAAENRIYVATMNPLDKPSDSSSMIIDPNGVVVASTLIDTEQATAALLPLFLSRCKTVVPGTDVVFDRTPTMYKSLTKTKVNEVSK
ncbi:carbon-nitrogen hydrolase family protein [Aquibacillus sediminis]|uniref:carbon-nitrogen hydrolase family protein n=1 Tax=Aquibacillus sediminis TaxID=2574734 RepID=UPI001FEABD66|nr:carbon-nitrogen hydrolase family protein [Aquibacillus sediminis]